MTRYPTTLRQTTHNQDSTPSVVVVREKHPLQGQSLPILGRMRRQGTLYVILSLPDGGTSMLPAVWTDLGGVEPSSTMRILGTVADLMHARKVVDVLLRRRDGTGMRPAEEEESHAIGTVPRRPGVMQDTLGLDATERGREGNVDQDVGTLVRQNHQASNERILS